MTFFKLTKNNFEYFTIRTHPQKTFKSGSKSEKFGVTGSVPIFGHHSKVEFVTRQNDANDGGALNERETVYLPHPVPAEYRNDGTTGFTDLYGDNKKRKEDTRKFITRETPEVRFIGPSAAPPPSPQERDAGINVGQESSVTSSMISMTKKSVMINSLMQYYRTMSPSMHFNYSNYHTLNFFTASSVPSDSALIYPLTGTGGEALDNSEYAVYDAFTFEFWVNPRYNFITDGTILHLSSNYAISLSTGSKKYHDGTTSHYKLKLQLSHSTDINPSSSIPGGVYPNDLCFTSSDNILERNKWHHVAIKWDEKVNDRTGSFVIDGVEKGIFHIPSRSIGPSGADRSTVLLVGNYYDTSGSSRGLISFFNDKSNINDGVANLVGDVAEPDTGPFTHPLNAELHEIRIFDKLRTNEQITNYRYKSLRNVDTFNYDNTGLVFYLPPFFTKETPVRNVRGTPYNTINDATEDPFNVNLSFGIGGLDINLENYVREFARGRRPRLLNLTGTLTNTDFDLVETRITDKPIVERLLDSPAHRKRNLTILPNDNGLFSPNHEMLKVSSLYTGTFKLRLNKFQNDFNHQSISDISLRNLVSTSSLLEPTITNVSGTKTPNSPFVMLAGVTPELPNGTPGEILSIVQRTQDANSNEICWFDISNMFFDREIKPSSLVIYDTGFTGSDDVVKLTLKDDGYGNIYRADANTTNAIWNSVGNIFYPEGLVLIKSPHLKHFGNDYFEMGLSGTHNIHVSKLYVKAPKGLVNSSSHQSYVSRKSDNKVVEHKTNNVIITGINLYNKDFNIVGKITLAQALEKYSQDTFMIKASMDW
tara:strand:+ start:8316 stop:10772 length:2457 start_codon:yes stop_codon:yes gene_type:complete